MGFSGITVVVWTQIDMTIVCRLLLGNTLPPTSYTGARTFLAVGTPYVKFKGLSKIAVRCTSQLSVWGNRLFKGMPLF